MTQEVWLGDCLELLDSVDPYSIDLLLTSPPYFNAKSYSYWETYEEYMCWLEKIFTKALFVLKEGRMCVVNLSVIIEPRLNRSQESKRIPLPFHFVSLMEKIGFKFLEDIIWAKPEGSSKNRNGRFYQDRQPVQYKPNVINEYILVFQKPMTGLIDKIVRSYVGKIKEQSLVENGYERTNIWYINPVTSSKHPAPFPQELSDRVIKYYSYVDDTVLDIFAGSGTSGVSAKNLNRNFILMEKEQEYYDLIMKRLQE
jgi:DNA modification methylase